MISLAEAVDTVVSAQAQSSKPPAIVLAGHNGSGKSTLWYRHLAPQLEMPLVNADRMMVSILPERDDQGRLVSWAQELRDQNQSWMRVAQRGVQAFVAEAMAAKVPFAMETVFSHWRRKTGGGFESKIDQIREMQSAGYFVLLIFVGLANAQLSILRVSTRVAEGGHSVDPEKLLRRFPRTQRAIREACDVTDAAIFVDNSRTARND